jgi:Zn-dependent oligopeptidase
MKIGLIFMVLIIGLTSDCKKAVKSDNPFSSTFDTPFEVPPFEKMKAAHYMPDYLKGIEEQKKEILTIVATKDQHDIYISFRGKEPGIDALLVNIGLKLFRYET